MRHRKAEGIDSQTPVVYTSCVEDMMNLRSLALSAICAIATLSPYATADYSGSYLWDPAVDNEANVYARVIQLNHAGSMNGRLLATWEHWYTDGPNNSSTVNGTEGSFIIRESADNGNTWTTISTVKDTQTGAGHPCVRFWQPFFFEFPSQLGKYPAGTLLLVGNLVPADKAYTQFFTWRSMDHGKTWEPVGEWQRGGTNLDGIWEPFLFLNKQGNIVAVFSDERNSTYHSQMLVHVVSQDGGDTWSDIVLDVATSPQTDRPGMATVSLMGNGKYLMSYEVCGRTNCPVHVKTSIDGVTWDSGEVGSPVITPDGYYGGSSPYNVWDATSKQLVLAAHNFWNITTNRLAPPTHRGVFLNKNYGAGSWSWAPAPWDVSNASSVCNSNYSPDLLLRPDGIIRYTAPAAQGSTGLCSEKTGQAPVGILPYESNFAANNQQGWNDYGGSWSVSGDEYAVATVGNAATGIALTGSSGWTDYEISADVQIAGSAGVVGLTARVTAPNMGLNAFKGYTVAINTFTGNLTISKETNDMVVLGSHTAFGGIKTNTWYRLSLSVKGSNITGILSTEKGGFMTAFSSAESSYAEGMAGLSATIGGGRFRNVKIH